MYDVDKERENMETDELLCKLAKLSINYQDKNINKCIEQILQSNISDSYKNQIRDAIKPKKPIRIVTDFDERTESKISMRELELSCKRIVPIYTITDIRDLVQFVGYCKYINADNYNVYMRGQPNLYDGKMIPSLYRGQYNYTTATHNFRNRLHHIIKDLSILNKYDKRIVEPMLQHYGVKTTCIDLVDNVWIALWFGLYCAEGMFAGGRENIYYSLSKNEFAYIILIATDAINSTEKGVYEGELSRLIDLRKAVPSYFVRTHAQHALMLNRNIVDVNNVTRDDIDLSDLIVGIAEIPVAKGIEWIGNNKLMSVGTLFPSAYFDYGYRKLLDQYPLRDKAQAKDWGSIQIVDD